MITTVLGVLVAVNCVWVALAFGTYQAHDLFPLPFVYLLEIALIGVATAWISWRETHTYWLLAFSGILSVFVVLGGFSIGFFLVPAALVTLLLALRLHDPARLSALHGFGLAFGAGAMQAVGMLSVVWLY